MENIERKSLDMPMVTTDAKWGDVTSEEYACRCHGGVCFVHGDGVKNAARLRFMYGVTELLGFNREVEPYNSDRHLLARTILHSADNYVRRILAQIEAGKGVQGNETH